MPAGEAQRKPRIERPAKRRSAVGWFVHRYGWRVYAIPVLIALTVLAILQIARPSVPAVGTELVAGGPSAATVPPATVTVSTLATTTVAMTGPGTTTTVVTTPTASPGTPTPSAADPNTSWAKDLVAGALPPGGAFTATGAGTWHVVKGTSPKAGSGTDVLTYTIEVEDGIKADDAAFADAVVAVLTDPRSWIGNGKVALQRVDSGEPDFRISLTSQKTIRDPGFCGFDLPLEASCYNRAVGRVMLNDARWERGAIAFNGDLGLYRVYAINHEVGHALGFGHQPCAMDGGLAPVMMQQSFSTSNNDLAPLDPGNIPADGKTCRVNPYPFPMADQAAPTASSATPSG